MSRAARFGPAALAAALLLAGCGGGGTSPAQPAAAPHPTALPAANRTAVGTATLVLKLPKVLTAKNGKTVAAKGANARHAQYVDPNPAPSPSSSPVPTAPTNLIDIYVDNTLVPNIDTLAGAYGASVEVTTVNTDATQTIVLPLYSMSNNVIVAAEFDGTHTNLLAIGEANVGTFIAGSANNISLTMQMNAQTLGIVDQPAESAPTAMNTANNGFGLFIFPCSYGSTAQVGVYTVDLNGSYGGTGFATVTGASDYSGSSSLSPPQSAFPGLYTITFDGSCDSIMLTGTSPNPAYAIYNDVQSTSSTNYTYSQGLSNTTTNGPNQGIWNLYNSYNPTNSFSGQSFSQSLSEAANATATGQIDVSNLYNSG
jgi:hypothetical protein